MSLSFKNLTIGVGQFSRRLGDREFPAYGLIVLQGPNGSGKTTLLRTLAGRLPKRSGEIRGLPARLSGCGFEGLLMTEWTVQQNLGFFSKLIGRAPLDAELSDLERIRPLKVKNLSLGWKRRAELSLLMAFDFSLLLLDEPLSPLDLPSKKLYQERIQRYAKRALILISSHGDLNAALRDPVIDFGVDHPSEAAR